MKLLEVNIQTPDTDSFFLANVSQLDIYCSFMADVFGLLGTSLMMSQKKTVAYETQAAGKNVETKHSFLGFFS